MKILWLPFVSLDEQVFHIFQKMVKHRQGIIEYAFGSDWGLYVAHVFWFIDDWVDLGIPSVTARPEPALVASLVQWVAGGDAPEKEES
jgi:hypothetical protein